MADFTALKTAIQNAIKQNGNEEITGDILQDVLLAIVSTLGDSAINDLVTALANEVAARQNADGTLQQNITNEATTRGNADTALGTRIDNEVTARENADTALSNRITAITDAIDNGYVYAGIATTSTEPATGKVFYLTTATGVFTNFGGITDNTKGIKILKKVDSTWTSDTIIVMDDTPTENSTNLVKSGGVYASIASVLSKIAEGYLYMGIATAATNPSTPTTKVFYIAVAAGTYTNFLDSDSAALVLTQGINILKYNGTSWSVEQVWGVDDEPTAGSNKLVKSGGVFNDIMTNGSAFDLSAYNNGTTYADLNAALTALNALPADYKKGGMSLKFVRTSDNKYVQYMYVGTSTVAADFINTDNWVKINIEEDVEGTSGQVSFSNTYYEIPIEAGITCREGDEIEIKVTDYSGAATIYIFGITSSGADTIAEDVELNTIVKFKAVSSWTKIRIYKNDSVQLSFNYAFHSGLIYQTAAKLENYIVGSSYDYYSQIARFDVPIGVGTKFPYNSKVKITIVEYSGTNPIYIFGVKSDTTADTIAENVALNTPVEIILNSAWVSLRVYKNDTTQLKFNIFIEGDYIKKNIEPIRTDVESINDLVSIEQTSVTVTSSLDVFEDVKEGEIIKVTVDNYAGTAGHIYLFGIVSTTPLVLDAYLDLLKRDSGCSYYLQMKRDYAFFRIYNTDASNSATCTVSRWKYSKIEEGYSVKQDSIPLISIKSRQSVRSFDYSGLTGMIGKTIDISVFDNTVNNNKYYIFGVTSLNPLAYDDLGYGTSGRFTIKPTKEYVAFRVYQKDSASDYDIDVNICLYAQFDGNAQIDDYNVDKVDRLEVLPENPLAIIKRDAGYGTIIHEWGFIGDSLSSGCTVCRPKDNPSNQTFLDLYEYSWGQRLCKLLGVNGYNFSYSGQQAIAWCNGWVDTSSIPPSTTPNPEDRIWDGETVGISGQHGAKYNPKQGYIIAMGVNDSSPDRHDYPNGLGTIEDVNLNDYTQNGQSFYGYYAGIIQRVRSIAPDSVIFCVTIPTPSTSGSYNNAIRSIVELFNKCYVIDLQYNGVSYDNAFKERYFLGNHMNAAGYEYTAYVMNTYIDWIIRNNFADFDDAALINTQYEKIPD